MTEDKTLGDHSASADPLQAHPHTRLATMTDEQEVHERIQTEHGLFVDLAERYIALYRQLPQIETVAMPYFAQLRELLRQLGTLLATLDERGTMPESTRDDELIARYIEPHPDKRGPDKARLREVYVPVRTLIAYLNVVGGSVDQVAHDYEIPREAVEAVVAYYRRYQAMFDSISASL
ncbi:MAG: DUF433 domain-containing protein [Chloroflexi bacterium]|nr:DUF433 domain-containing protein [Chloroflexota bacterium]